MLSPLWGSFYSGDWLRASPNGAITITWSLISAKPMSIWWTRMLTNSETWMLHTHLKPISKDNLYNPKVGTHDYGHQFIIQPNLKYSHSLSFCLWVMELNNCQKSVFEEHYNVILKPAFDNQICIPSWVKVDICASWNDNISRHIWDIVFMRMVKEDR